VNAPSPGIRGINPWIVAIAVIVPTFMEVLDTTVANVALSHIAGGLSAAVTDSEWVITSYLAANAIILPITGWLASHFGRRNYFLFSIAVFTASSLLCGLATNLGMLIFFRALQGLAGGGLQPCSQGILLDTFPPEKQGTAQTAFGLAALLAPVVGPTLGGYLTDSYSWRWIFYVNVPVGIAAFFFCSAVVRDPAYLQEELASLKNKVFRFDNIGLGLLVIMVVAWEILLSKGQEWDWIGDPFGRIQVLAVLFVLGLGGLVWWELRQDQPIINFRVLLDRNFAIPASSSFSPTPFSTAPARNCRRCSKPSSATTPSTPGSSSRPRDSSRSWPSSSPAACSASASTAAGSSASASSSWPHPDIGCRK
jgi:DHA2 family multidrug resistance protein